MQKKQQGGKKKRKKCEAIIGHPVIAVFINGDLPQGAALAWTKGNGAYLVNIKKKGFVEYVKDGKFLVHKVHNPVKLFIKTKNQANDELTVKTYDGTTLYEKYVFETDKLKQEVKEDQEREKMLEEIRQIQGNLWDAT